MSLCRRNKRRAIMKKILAVLALAICVSWLPVTADAKKQKKQKAESGKITRVEFNAAKGTVSVDGVEYSIADIKAKIAKENWKPKPNKNGKGSGVRFLDTEETCQIVLGDDLQATFDSACHFDFYLYEPLIDIELGFYTADGKQHLANYGYSPDGESPPSGFSKEDFIATMNYCLEAFGGEDGFIILVFPYGATTMFTEVYTEYGLTKAVPSLYLFELEHLNPGDIYLLLPGEYVHKAWVETESGTFANDGPFSLSYTPIPDPKGMFPGQGVKDPAALKAEKIKKIYTNIYKVVDGVNNKNINVFDTTGRRVLNSNNEVNIGNLSTGVYFLQVEDAVKKVVKE